MYLFLDDLDFSGVNIVQEKIKDELIEKTRQIIIEMYVRCEKNFVEGVKLFNAIVLAVKLETGISRKQGFQKMKMNILGGGNGVNGGP